MNGLKEDGGQLSSSRTLSAELSLAEGGNLSTPGEETDTPADTPEAETPQQKSAPSDDAHAPQNEPTLVRELETLKKLHAEKEQRMVELHQHYSDLHEQHQDTLDYVEELKTEVTKAQMARPTSPTAQIIRRKSSQQVVVNDRSNRAFASLRNMALENFEDQPDIIQNFELNLNAVMTELHIRSERVQALETEVAAVRKEMEGKMAMITGLTKERSSLKAGSPLDISIVATMQGQIKQHEDQMKEMQEAHAQRESELQEQVINLKASLQPPDVSLEPISPRQTSHFVSRSVEESGDGIVDDSQEYVARLQEEVNLWQSKHVQAIEVAKVSEQKHLENVQTLESAMKKLEAEHASRIIELEQSKDAHAQVELEREKAKHAELVAALNAQVDEHKSIAVSNAARLADLELSHSNIVKQVEEDAEARQLTEKELDTHRSLVANLEKQIEEHKSAIDIHQQGLDSLKQSHAVDIEKLTASLTTKEESIRALNSDLTQARVDMEGLLKGISSKLNVEADLTKIQNEIGTLAEERKSLSSRMELATKELQAARTELSESAKTIEKLKGTVKEFEIINAETIKELEAVNEKELRSSRLVQELEDQLNQNWDQHEAANNRLSALQTERSQELTDAMNRKNAIEKEVEESRIKIALLESQLLDAQRASANRESIDPRENLQRSNSNNSNLRKSTSHNSLPSPPPAIPLPPLPGSPPPNQAPSPPTSRHQSKDIAHAQLVEDQEARIRTIEKHLFAEKQLTATLEDALTDLENSSTKTKKEMESWKKKCDTLEEELTVMRKERSMARHSLQAVEEERNARLRVEAERAHLEARMAALNNATKKNKKNKGTLNCF